jgi:hypothetical protein
MRPHLNQWLGTVTCACHPQLSREAHSPGRTGIKQDPVSKITYTERFGDMIQVVEHLVQVPEFKL